MIKYQERKIKFTDQTKYASNKARINLRHPFLVTTMNHHPLLPEKHPR